MIHFIDFMAGDESTEPMSFAMPGLSQPSFPAEQAHVFLSDEVITKIGRVMPLLAQGNKLVVTSPDGTRLIAEFVKWHGVFALLYIPADDVTIAVYVGELPIYVRGRA